MSLEEGKLNRSWQIPRDRCDDHRLYLVRGKRVCMALPAALAILLLVGLSAGGCRSKETATPTPTKTPTTAPLVTATPTANLLPPTATPTTNVPTPTSSATATPTPTPTATAEPTLALVAIGPDVNPLTGLKVDDPARLERRPLAIKMPNYPPEARPLSGISLADVVIEHEAEAHLTRFAAIFLGNDASLVGPIRSLRLVDAETVPIFKAVLVASGGHPAVKIRITEGRPWAEGYKRIICPEAPFLGDGGTGRRIPDKKPIYELTWYSDTPGMWNLCTKRGVNQRQDFYNMFVFSETPPGGGREATHLKVVYKAAVSETEYRYDAESRTYKRFDMGEPTVDELTGAQVGPSNVIVLYVNHVDSDIMADTHDLDNPWYSVSIQLWGQGPARLLRDGQVYDCTWVRENPQQDNDRLIFLGGEGKQIPFRPGPTWMQLVRLDGNVTID
jgi:hypothetical protein